jgi:4-amino-4-deoxy-L-arabinose transferase-like glycosyltransferase
MLVLASDWCFLFYRRVLGGTELLLLCAGLLLLWGFWRGRWSGRDGSLLVGLGLGLGVLAKVTFLPTALALGLAALITRWDRPTGARSARLRWGLVLGIAAVCSAPLWIALLHSSALPDTPRLWSHDGLALQLTRLQHGLGALVSGGGSGAAREVPASLAWFFFEPLRWFAPALDAEPVGWGWAWLRGLGWLIVLAGVALTWLGRPWRAASRDRHEALLRFLSVAVPLQLALLWFANRDLHHLAQATPTVALLAGLAIERVAQRFSAPNSVRRAGLALLLCLPLVVAGGASVVRTKAVVESVPALAITEPGQRALLDLLAEHRVRRLWTSDYDLYGVFELRQPELALSHAWGAASVTHDRPALLAELLRAARGGHYLAVRPAAARIYDLAPGDADVQRAALEAGVEAVLVDEIEGPGWARLYSVAGR